MSELSELIKINKNIERQNDEIIRLLKKIAGEGEVKENSLPKIDADEIRREMSKISKSKNQKADKRAEVPIKPEKDESEMLLNRSHDVGEVCFMEDQNIFKVIHKNNKTMVNNLNSMAYPIDFKLQEMVAIESVRKNQSLDDATVILNKSQSMSLPKTLKICYDEGAKNVFIPLSASTQLLGAPETLMSIIKINIYKSEEDLIDMLFTKGD